MKTKDFDKFWRKERKHLVALLVSLKGDIDDDMIHEEETVPSLELTISCDDDLNDWSYQTGDNSFTGNCYGDSYWGIGTLYRRSNCKELANELINSLADAINFED